MCFLGHLTHLGDALVQHNIFSIVYLGIQHILKTSKKYGLGWTCQIGESEKKNYSEMMDSDNSNRKTSHFHAQKILDAAADIKAKKSRGVRRERQNDPIYLKTRVCPEKNPHVIGLAQSPILTCLY